MKNELAIAVFRAGGLGRKHSHFKVAIDVAVESLKAEIPGKPFGEIQLNIPVDRGEVRFLPRIFPEDDLHASVYRFGYAGASNVLHFDFAVDVVHGKVARYATHAHM